MPSPLLLAALGAAFVLLDQLAAVGARPGTPAPAAGCLGLSLLLAAGWLAAALVVPPLWWLALVVLVFGAAPAAAVLAIVVLSDLFSHGSGRDGVVLASA